MNQGTTAVYNEFGRMAGLQILKRRAEDMFDRVKDMANGFSTDPIYLGSDDDLPKGYAAGHSFGKTYRSDQLEEKELVKDLMTMLKAYQALIDRGGMIPTDIMLEEAESHDIEECRRYVLLSYSANAGQVLA